MTSDPFHVERYATVRGVPLLEQLDALDVASRTPSLFFSRAFLSALLEHDERRVPGDEVVLLAAVDGGTRLAGLLPLRRLPERTLGIRWNRLEPLVSEDSDHPGMIARPEDETRCAEAFWRHLLEHDPDWSELDLLNQEAGSPLLATLGEPPGVLVRKQPGNSIAIVSFTNPDLATYFHSLPKKFRLNVGRLGRRLLAAGHLELVCSSDPRALPSLLDLFLDVEHRSWKRDLGVGRHPERVARYRELCAGDPLGETIAQILLLDGVPVAGMICASWAGRLLGLETAYDQGYQELAPGNLMMLLCMREALRRRAPSVNLLGNYGYYKESWGAALRETTTLKLARVGTPPWARAVAGQVKRSLTEAHADAADERFNQEKRSRDGEHDLENGPPRREAERGRARALLATLEASGASVERLGGEALLQELPFHVQQAAE